MSESFYWHTEGSGADFDEHKNYIDYIDSIRSITRVGFNCGNSELVKKNIPSLTQFTVSFTVYACADADNSKAAWLWLKLKGSDGDKEISFISGSDSALALFPDTNGYAPPYKYGFTNIAVHVDSIADTLSYYINGEPVYQRSNAGISGYTFSSVSMSPTGGGSNYNAQSNAISNVTIYTDDYIESLKKTCGIIFDGKTNYAKIHVSLIGVTEWSAELSFSTTERRFESAIYHQHCLFGYDSAGYVSRDFHIDAKDGKLWIFSGLGSTKEPVGGTINSDSGDYGIDTGITINDGGIHTVKAVSTASQLEVYCDNVLATTLYPSLTMKSDALYIGCSYDGEKVFGQLTLYSFKLQKGNKTVAQYTPTKEQALTRLLTDESGNGNCATLYGDSYSTVDTLLYADFSVDTLRTVPEKAVTVSSDVERNVMRTVTLYADTLYSIKKLAETTVSFDTRRAISQSETVSLDTSRTIGIAGSLSLPTERSLSKTVSVSGDIERKVTAQYSQQISLSTERKIYAENYDKYIHLYVDDVVVGTTDNPLAVNMDIRSDRIKYVKCVIKVEAGYVPPNSGEIYFDGDDGDHWKVALDDGYTEKDVIYRPTFSRSIAFSDLNGKVIWLRVTSAPNEAPKCDAVSLCIRFNDETLKRSMIRQLALKATVYPRMERKVDKGLISVVADTGRRIKREIDIFDGKIKSITITIAENTVSDTIQLEGVNLDLYPRDVVSGKLLDYSFNNVMVKTSSIDGIVWKVSLVDDYYRKNLQTACAYVYTKDLEVVKEYTIGNTTYQTRKTPYFGRVVSSVAKSFGLKSVLLFDDFRADQTYDGSYFSYQSFLNSFFGWTHEMPWREINCFTDGDTFYAIERGKEPNTIKLDDIPHTRPKVACDIDIHNSTWTDSGSSEDKGEELWLHYKPWVDPVREIFGDWYYQTPAGGSVYGQNDTTSGRPSYAHTSNPDGSSVDVSYEYSDTDDGVDMTTEYRTETDTDGNTSTTTTVHKDAGFRNTYAEAYDSDGNSIGSSVYSGFPITSGIEKQFQTNSNNEHVVGGNEEFNVKIATIRKPKHHHWSITYDVFGHILSSTSDGEGNQSSNLRRNALNFKEMCKYATHYFKETVTTDIVAPVVSGECSYGHIIDMRDAIVWNGKTYHLETNTVTATPKEIRQSLKIVRWRKRHE